jgi:phenylpyruvate tautomerase PptA (4-oxalocrotonate tautomerase family)
MRQLFYEPLRKTGGLEVAPIQTPQQVAVTRLPERERRDKPPRFDIISDEMARGNADPQPAQGRLQGKVIMLEANRRSCRKHLMGRTSLGPFGKGLRARLRNEALECSKGRGRGRDFGALAQQMRRHHRPDLFSKQELIGGAQHCFVFHRGDGDIVISGTLIKLPKRCAKAHIDAGMARREAMQPRNDPADSKRAETGDLQKAFLAREDGAQGYLQRIENRCQVRTQRAPDLGQLRTGAGSREKLDIEHLFQMRDLAADGAMRDPQLARRRRRAAQPCRRLEGAKGVERQGTPMTDHSIFSHIKPAIISIETALFLTVINCYHHIQRRRPLPIVRTNVRNDTNEATRAQIVQGIHQALIDAIGMPEDELFNFIAPYAPQDCVYSRSFNGIARSDRLVVVEITMRRGRSDAMKRALYAGIAANLEAMAGISPKDVFIVLHENDYSDWSVGNGVFAMAIQQQRGQD